VGIEAELNSRLNENFDISASASLNNSELRSDVRDSSGAILQALRSGNRLPTVPKFQAAISLGYVRPMENGLTAFSNLSWQYVGDRYTQISDQENNPRTVSLFGIGSPSVSTLAFQLKLPSYTNANFRMGLRSGQDWEAALFVNNLTDERAKLAIDRERGLRARYGYLVNQPRTYGVSLRKSF
jgi:iron complex outermembrane receptor protein